MKGSHFGFNDDLSLNCDELVSHVAHNSNMERLTVYFIDMLQGLLEGFEGVHIHRDDHHHHHQNDTLTTFQLLHDMIQSNIVNVLCFSLSLSLYIYLSECKIKRLSHISTRPHYHKYVVNVKQRLREREVGEKTICG